MFNYLTVEHLDFKLFEFSMKDTFIPDNIFLLSTAEVAFPAVTICPAYESAYKMDVLNKNNLTLDLFRRDFNYPKNISRLTGK